MEDHVDIVIHGAGIPGLTLALLVSQTTGTQPCIQVHDRRLPQVNAQFQQLPVRVEDYDLRVFALAQAGRRVFEKIGVWPSEGCLSDSRVYPYEQMTVRDAGGDGQVHFDAADTGQSSLGYIVESSVIMNWLVAACSRCANIEIVAGRELRTIEESNAVSRLRLRFASGEGVTTRLLVAADGGSSRVRELAGIQSVGWDYHQSALVAAVKTTRSYDRTAWQCFLPTGPLAFLPMSGNCYSIVWTLPSEKAESYYQMDIADFQPLLEKASQRASGDIEVIGPRAVFPLRLAHAEKYCMPGLAMVADAIHCVHPLAGQGLNLGLQDVTALGNRIAEALAQGKSPGDYAMLRRYERCRKGNNWLMQLSFDGINRLFSNDMGSLRALRNFGLSQVNHLAPLRNFFARQASGL